MPLELPKLSVKTLVISGASILLFTVGTIMLVVSFLPRKPSAAPAKTGSNKQQAPLGGKKTPEVEDVPYVIEVGNTSTSTALKDGLTPGKVAVAKPPKTPKAPKRTPEEKEKAKQARKEEILKQYDARNAQLIKEREEVNKKLEEQFKIMDKVYVVDITPLQTDDSKLEKKEVLKERMMLPNKQKVEVHYYPEKVVQKELTGGADLSAALKKVAVSMPSSGVTGKNNVVTEGCEDEEWDE